MTKKAALIILDGWGIGPDPTRSAIDKADTPFVDQMLEDYPNSTLITFGEQVGLPKGQMGNSEVGHLNIGAGRIVYQELVRINRAIESGDLARNPVLVETIRQASLQNKRVHLMGLVSDGGVHSHINHLLALVSIFEDAGLDNVFIHAFLDGRDTSPYAGKQYLSIVSDHCKDKRASLATVVGRYYAMDRDRRWERIKIAYDLLVHGIGKPTDNLGETIQSYYDDGITDEFMKPVLVDPAGCLGEGDIVVFFNFRTDRPRQLTEVLTQQNFPDFDMKTLDLNYVTMTEYDQTYRGIQILFEKDNLNNTFGELVSEHGLKQIRLAETEKYPHVTYFFSGGREEPFTNEERIVIPSPKVATYDLMPEMSAWGVTEAAYEKIMQSQPDFICLNYANTDMVGHTGVFEAAMKAATTVDQCLKKLIPHLIQHRYSIVIIADHGNSDYMINPDGSPHTAHTTNPVPCIVISDKNYEVKDGKLADIAPTLCALMELPIPEEMDGSILIKEVALEDA